MKTSNRKVVSIAQDLVANNSKELDLITREFSYGKDGDNMIQADRTGIKLGWKIKNDTATDVIVAIAPTHIFNKGIDVGGATVLPSGLPASTVVFATGAQLVSGGDSFEITELDSDRKIADFRGFAAIAPTQITKFHLKSRNITTNTPDDSNYENPIQTYWVSPFFAPEKKQYQLRTLQNSSMNSPQFAEVDFLKENFNALISQEHVILLRVNSRTELVVTASIGAHDSRAQRFFRATRDANKALLGLRVADAK